MRHRFILFLTLLLISSCGIFRKKTKTSLSPVTISTPRTSEILIKYKEKIGQPISNETLYQFIDQWYSVPYKFGGKSKSGIDCSNFTCLLLREVYGFASSFYFPSSKLAEQGKKVNHGDYREGDLVFFSINQSSKISHVGVYLANNKFVHASTSKGVIISSLNEEYYKKRFAFVARLK